MSKMAIIKVNINFPEIRKAISEFHLAPKKAFESLVGEIRDATTGAIEELLNAEMSLFLGTPGQEDNKRNGYRLRVFALKGIGTIQLHFPIDRKHKFKSLIIPKGDQIDPRLKEDMAVLLLAGISSRTMEMISKRILGVEVSRQTILDSLELIRPKALEWMDRPITNKYWCLYVDGTNFKIQRRGSTDREPILVVLGIDEKNCRSIIAMEPGSKDDSNCWKEVFKTLTKRGLKSSFVRLGIMDGLPGLENAFKEFFPNSQTQRCWVHALKNALAKTSLKLRPAFKSLALKVMYAPSEDSARMAFKKLKELMGADCQKASKTLEKDLDSLLTFFRFEKEFWLALRTTNPIERVNKEFKKRAKTMGSMGEETQDCLLAFISLQLELKWRSNPVNSTKLLHLKNTQVKQNYVEEAVSSLLN